MEDPPGADVKAAAADTACQERFVNIAVKVSKFIVDSRAI